MSQGYKMWKRPVTLIMMMASVTLVALLLFTVRSMQSIRTIESHEMKGSSDQHDKVNVSIRELLSLVGESATIPPHVPVNKSCEPEELPR